MAAKRFPNQVTKTAGKLTEKQERFCREYVVDLNATQAAIRAGYTSRNPATAGGECLRYPQVLARIEQLQAARAKRTEVSADWVLRRLVEELDANVRDLYAEDGTLKPAKDWPEVWQRGLVTHIQTTELYAKDHTGKSVVIGRTKDVTFADRVKRIELLGRHIAVQAFKERVQIGVDAPLRALFEQIQGQSIRPAIEHEPQPEPEAEGEEGDAS